MHYKSKVGRHGSKCQNVQGAAGGRPNNAQYADDTTMPAQNKENTVVLAERVENRREVAGFKLNIKKQSEMSNGGRSGNLCKR